MKRQRLDFEDEKTLHEKNKSHDIPVEVRNFIGEFGALWKLHVGKIVDFQRILEEMGYQIPKASLSRWIGRSEKEETPVTLYENVGRPPLLTEEQERIIIGGIFSKNQRGELVTLQTVVNVARELFGISFSDMTASRLLSSFDITNRVAKRRQGGFVQNLEEMTLLYRQWIITQRKLGYMSLHPSLIGSIDFTYTSRRVMIANTFAASGG